MELLLMLPSVLVGLAFSLIFNGDDGDEPSEATFVDGQNFTESGDLLDMVDAQSDTINALGGDDTITTSEAGDFDLRLGSGDDIATLTDGTTIVYAREGDDTVESAVGDLTAFLGSGDDVATVVDGTLLAQGGEGSDTLLGGTGDDTLFGGVGDDEIDGRDGGDSLSGGFGSDRILGGLGGDMLDGGGADDTLVGGEGADMLAGGSGADLLDARSLGESTPVSDTLDGGEGDDILAFDAGDSATGGVGVDSFSVFLGEAGPEGTAMITDFDTATETLALRVVVPDLDPASPPQFDAAQVALADGSGVAITVEGETVVILQGVDPQAPVAFDILGVASA